VPVTPTIAEQVTELKHGQQGRLPGEVLATFSAEQEALRQSGLPDGIASPGGPMPDAELLDVNGAATTLGAVRGGKAAAVVFYRGGWCPYCNLALRTYQAELVPGLAARGIGLIAVSPQKPDGSLSTKEAAQLTFTVVSDPGSQIAAKLGILTTPTAEVRNVQLSLGLDLTERNADGTVTLPMPTVVIVAADGTIRWIDVHPDYTSRTEVAAILAALDELS
jgi:peroxiredoxin